MPVTKQCEGCGKPYSLPPSEAKRSRHCSRACRKSSICLTCKGCQKEFKVKPYEQGRAKFCSRECIKLSGAMLTCQYCQKGFRVKASLSKTARFCSRPCKYGGGNARIHPDGTKQCSSCKERMSVADFNKDRTKPTGLRNECRTCQFILNWMQRRPGDTKDDARRSLRGWFYVLLFELVAKVKWCGSGLHYASWDDFTIARRQRHGLATQCKDCWQIYYQQNFPAISTRVRNAEARRKGARGGYNESQWQAKYDFWGGRCYLCKAKVDFESAHREHRKPIIRGGLNFIANVAPACESCNLRKGRKTEKEFRLLLTNSTHLHRPGSQASG